MTNRRKGWDHHDDHLPLTGTHWARTTDRPTDNPPPQPASECQQLHGSAELAACLMQYRALAAGSRWAVVGASERTAAGHRSTPARLRQCTHTIDLRATPAKMQAHNCTQLQYLASPCPQRGRERLPQHSRGRHATWVCTADLHHVTKMTTRLTPVPNCHVAQPAILRHVQTCRNTAHTGHSRHTLSVEFAVKRATITPSCSQPSQQAAQPSICGAGRHSAACPHSHAQQKPPTRRQRLPA